MLKYHIQTIELSAPASTISISNIPQIYDDLYLVTSLRSDGGGTGFFARLAMTFNNVTTNRSSRVLYGFNSGSVGSETSSTLSWFYTVSTSATVNTYGNNGIYISNYKAAQSKTISIDSTTEHNGTEHIGAITAGLWADSSAINSIQIFFNEAGSNFFTNSSVSIYGIKRGSDGRTEVASGGTITTSGLYTYHSFTSSGTFVANRDLQVEALVVAGGGGGGRIVAGGGGAGGLVYSAAQISANQSFPVIVGAGGPGATTAAYRVGEPGNNSSFSPVGTAIYGGGGGAGSPSLPQSIKSGGSGGGGVGIQNWGTSMLGGIGVSGQGNNGGDGWGDGDTSNGGGGGGAGAAGQTADINGPGDGGSGSSSYSAFGAATGLGHNISGTYWFAGGGGGGGSGLGYSASNKGLGGNGGGGDGGITNRSTGTDLLAATAGLANTGGGGGGACNDYSGNNSTTQGKNGGSGVVIIRYLTPAS